MRINANNGLKCNQKVVRPDIPVVNRPKCILNSVGMTYFNFHIS